MKPGIQPTDRLTIEQAEELVVQHAESIRSVLHRTGRLPVDTKFINLRFDDNGAFDGNLFESLGISRLRAREAKERIKSKNTQPQF